MITNKPSKQVEKFDGHERFLSKIRVNLETECWEWTAGIQKNGYGSFPIRSRKNSAHRVSYSIFKGATSANKVIDHRCRNRKCVSPEHLREVFQKQNALENSLGVCAINIQKTHCPSGHEYTPENTAMTGKAHNKKRCKICHLAYQKQLHRRKAIARLF